MVGFLETEKTRAFNIQDYIKQKDIQVGSLYESTLENRHYYILVYGLSVEQQSANVYVRHLDTIPNEEYIEEIALRDDNVTYLPLSFLTFFIKVKQYNQSLFNYSEYKGYYDMSMRYLKLVTNLKLGSVFEIEGFYYEVVLNIDPLVMVSLSNKPTNKSIDKDVLELLKYEKEVNYELLNNSSLSGLVADLQNVSKIRELVGLYSYLHLSDMNYCGELDEGKIRAIYMKCKLLGGILEC